MKPSLAFIVSVSFLSYVILMCAARPIKLPNPAVPIPSPVFSPIIAAVSTSNPIETASYISRNESKIYVGHQTSEDDGSVAAPKMSHQQGHSPGVGHSYPYSLCCT
ncbi:hypothetical protein SUGI_0699530 [Cryptomeria japonica]|nr:hypothetical protein SUGI_0699530 [Cryptomeria japonica]